MRRELVQRPAAHARSPDRRIVSEPRCESGSWREDRAAHPQARHSPRFSRAGGIPSGPSKKKPKKKKKVKTGSGGAAGGSQSGLPTVPPSGIPGGAQPTASQRGSGTSQPQEEEGIGSPSRHQCFNCGVVGHFRSQCTQPECCMRCGDTGHRWAACTVSAGQSLRPRLELLGHGVESIFYYIDLGGTPMTVPQNLALVTVLPDQLPPVAAGLTVEILRDELAQVMPGHEWQVPEISSSEFAVVFPSAEMLRQIGRAHV